MNRRTALAGVSAAAMGFTLLGACQSPQNSLIQSDVQTLAAGLSNIVADLQAVPGLAISPSTITQIQTEVAAIQSDAAAIANVVASAGVPPLTTFAAAVTALVPLVTPFFPAAPMVAVAMQAAVTLLQSILANGKMGADSSRKVARARAVLKATATR